MFLISNQLTKEASEYSPMTCASYGVHIGRFYEAEQLWENGSIPLNPTSAKSEFPFLPPSSHYHHHSPCATSVSTSFNMDAITLTQCRAPPPTMRLSSLVRMKLASQAIVTQLDVLIKIVNEAVTKPSPALKRRSYLGWMAYAAVADTWYRYNGDKLLHGIFTSVSYFFHRNRHLNSQWHHSFQPQAPPTSHLIIQVSSLASPSWSPSS